jgi:flagellar hook assembly protein FlgD
LLPWPNPFNANVTVAFELPKTSLVELVILDLTGRRVRSLANGIFPAGRHRLFWDGSDDHGRSQASGVYLLRLHAGKHIATQKVVMVK